MCHLQHVRNFAVRHAMISQPVWIPAIPGSCEIDGSKQVKTLVLWFISKTSGIQHPQKAGKT
jgi:hypothetical protein